jgi:hypothetical protein
MTDFKATPEQWAQCEEFLSNPVVGATDACILELRARVEALEANHPEKPDSSASAGSLVKRVDKAIFDTLNSHEGWRSEARAAIREVAVWLRDLPGWEESTLDAIGALLEQEAKR